MTLRFRAARPASAGSTGRSPPRCALDRSSEQMAIPLVDGVRLSIASCSLGHRVRDEPPTGHGRRHRHGLRAWHSQPAAHRAPGPQGWWWPSSISHGAVEGYVGVGQRRQGGGGQALGAARVSFNTIMTSMVRNPAARVWWPDGSVRRSSDHERTGLARLVARWSTARLASAAHRHAEGLHNLQEACGTFRRVPVRDCLRRRWRRRPPAVRPLREREVIRARPWTATRPVVAHARCQGQLVGNKHARWIAGPRAFHHLAMDDVVVPAVRGGRPHALLFSATLPRAWALLRVPRDPFARGDHPAGRSRRLRHRPPPSLASCSPRPSAKVAPTAATPLSARFSARTSSPGSWRLAEVRLSSPATLAELATLSTGRPSISSGPRRIAPLRR